MYPQSVKDLDVSIRSRAAIERAIVRSLLEEFHEQGFTFLVDDGGEERIACRTKTEALDALINTDDDQLGIVNDKGQTIGWIRLVYGNDGWDVMADWHVGLEVYMPKTLALVEKLS